MKTLVTAMAPIAMSLAALGVICIHIAVHGTVRDRDEGAAAHLWQLLMLGQVPLIAAFAVRWLSRAPKAAATVMAVQFLAATTAVAPVILLGW
jgi:hypothetical protein